MIIKDKSILNTCKEHLIQFKSAYPIDFWEYVNDMIDNKEINFTTIQVKQMLYFLNLLPDEYNIYDNFIEIIDSYYGIDTNITEVGSGFIPALALKIHKLQQIIKKGTIKTYDPLTGISKLDQLKIYREEFTKKTDLKNSDIVIGICPCESTVPAIINTLTNDKCFCLALCGCTHIPKEDLGKYKMTMESWFNYLYDKIDEHLPSNQKIIIENLQEVCNYKYPIILTKKR